MEETDAQFNARIDRDSLRRALVLLAAVLRAGQDGGIEGNIDVFALADLYNSWAVTGETDIKEEPVLEKFTNKGENEEDSQSTS